MVLAVSNNLTQLQRSIFERDRGFSQKLDDIKNKALADLEIQGTLETLVSSFSAFKHSEEKNNRHLLDKIDTMKPQATPQQNGNEVPEIKKSRSSLDGSLLILGESCKKAVLE